MSAPPPRVPLPFSTAPHRRDLIQPPGRGGGEEGLRRGLAAFTAAAPPLCLKPLEKLRRTVGGGGAPRRPVAVCLGSMVRVRGSGPL